MQKFKMLTIIFIVFGVLFSQNSSISAKITKSIFEEDNNSKTTSSKKITKKKYVGKKYKYKKYKYKKKYKAKPYKKKYKKKKYKKPAKKSVVVSNADTVKDKSSQNTLDNAQKTSLKGEAAIIDYDGKNIPGYNSNSADLKNDTKKQQDKIKTETDSSSDSLQKNASSKNATSENLKYKKNKSKQMTSSAKDAENEPFKYKRHILIIFLILLVAVYHFRTGRSSFSGKSSK